MSGRDSSDPYAVSGSDAALHARQRMKIEALRASLADADQLKQRGHDLLARCRRMTAVSGAVLLGVVLATASLALVCYHGYDGTYNGAVGGNWALLGAVVGIGAANFAWGWFAAQRRLGEVGRRLIARAEYQRRLATLQLSEARDGARDGAQDEARDEAVR